MKVIQRCNFWVAFLYKKLEGNIMGYRTLEISSAAEIHIKEGQLQLYCLSKDMQDNLR